MQDLRRMSFLENYAETNGVFAELQQQIAKLKEKSAKLKSKFAEDKQQEQPIVSKAIEKEAEHPAVVHQTTPESRCI